MKVRGAMTLLPLVLILGVTVSLPFLLGGSGPRDDGAPDREEDRGAPVEAPAPPVPEPDVKPGTLCGVVTGEPEAPGPGAWVAVTGLDREIRATLDSAGAFRFEGLPPGKQMDLWLGPDPDGVWIEKLASDVVLKPGETRTLAFTVPIHAEIRGKVIDEDRRPLEGVRVAVLPPRTDWRMQVPVAAVTGPDGRFYVGFGDTVREEPLRLVVDHVRDGFILEERIVDPADTGPRADVVVKLTRGERIAGTLLGPEGAPLPGAEIHILEDYRGDPAVRRPVEGRVWTDENGRFEDNAYRPGVYRIVATGDLGGTPYAVAKTGVRAGNEDVRLAFRGFGSLRVFFMREGSGEAAESRICRLLLIHDHAGEESEESVEWHRVLDTPEIEFPPLPEGYYRLTATHPGCEDIRSDLIHVPAGGTVGPIRYEFKAR